MSKDIKEFEEINDDTKDYNEDILIGKHFTSIKETVPKSSQKRLEDETYKIFERINFKNETGLVVGYIQSGKTLSFEALTAMGRDNEVSITIILAGISKILTDQTYNRIYDDFNINKGKYWILENTKKKGSNVGLHKQSISYIKNTLNSQFDPNTIVKKGLLIVSMKNYKHINSIAEVLSSPELSDLMKKAKVLIIDDEADQYSQNTSKKEDKYSSTYASIKNLRDACPRHTFIQYTATPTGIFLESLFDQLSPDFAENINPGEGYVSIESLFYSDKVDDESEGELSKSSPYVNIIYDDDEGSEDDGEDFIPKDLEKALAVFIVGGVDGYIKRNQDEDENEPANRSMLIHPSQLTSKQKNYYDEVVTKKNIWHKLLQQDSEDPAKSDLILRLKEAHEDLSDTCKENLKTFEDIMLYINEFMNDLRIHLINASKSATQSDSIPWEQGYGHILVSGNAVDRGTTVNGLTVTYMPRCDSDQIDTQMQRARFLGYKSKYKDLIRIYCTLETVDFYNNYYITQDDFRDLINKFEGKNFKEAKRYWRIQDGKKSSRQMIQRIENAKIITTGKNRGRWSYPRAPHLSSKLISNNQRIETFINSNNFQPLTEDHFDREGKYKVNIRLDKIKENLHHQFAILDFNETYKELLAYLSFTELKDMTNMYMIMETLEYMYHNHKVEDIAVYHFAYKSKKNRKRSYNEKGLLTGFHQGAQPDGRGEVPKGSYYSGDREIFDPLRVSLQIHKIDTSPRKGFSGETFNDIYTIALRLPDRILEEFSLQIGGADKDDEIFEGEDEYNS